MFSYGFLLLKISAMHWNYYMLDSSYYLYHFVRTQNNHGKWNQVYTHYYNLVAESFILIPAETATERWKPITNINKR